MHAGAKAAALLLFCASLAAYGKNADQAVADALIEKGSYSEAAAFLEGRLARGDDPALNFTLGIAYQLQGDVEKARLAYAKAESAGRVAEALVRQGYLQLSLHQYASAEAYFKAYLDRAPRKSEGYVHLGAYYYLRHRRDEARSYFERALDTALKEHPLPPNDLSHKYFWVGIVSEDSGDPKKAEKLYGKALRHSVKGSELWASEIIQLGNLHRRLGKKGRGKALLEDASAQCRKVACVPRAHAEVLLSLAQFNAGSGVGVDDLLARALQEFKKQPTDSNLKPDPEFFQCRVAHLYRRMERPDLAEPLYREAIDTAGKAPTLRLAKALASLASLHAEMGKPKEAAAEYERALKILNEYPDEAAETVRIRASLEALPDAGTPSRASDRAAP